MHGSLAFDLTVTSVLVPLVAGARVAVSGGGRARTGWPGWRPGGGRFALVKVVPAHLPVLAGLGGGAGRVGAAAGGGRGGAGRG